MLLAKSVDASFSISCPISLPSIREKFATADLLKELCTDAAISIVHDPLPE